LAAATSFMARVIFCVDWTERIRRWMSRSVANAQAAWRISIISPLGSPSEHGLTSIIEGLGSPSEHGSPRTTAHCVPP